PNDAASDGGILSANADVSTSDAAFPYQRNRDALGRVGRDCEADTLRRQDDRGVYADHAPGGVHQRSARTARIERRIGLDDVVEKPPCLTSHRTTKSAHDAGGDGVLKAVRAADCDRNLTDSHGTVSSNTHQPTHRSRNLHTSTS